MSKENPLTSDDYFQIVQCLNHCMDEVQKLRFIPSDEWGRLQKLRGKCEAAYNLLRRAEK